MDTAELERCGFAVVPDVLGADEVDRLIERVSVRARTEIGRGGVRNLLDIDAIRLLAESNSVRSLATQVLGEQAFVVRGILFDKTDASNWKVPWHQDVTIAVTEQTPVNGYGPWSVKAGVVHVQPPREILECMVSVRLHLDDCPAENGALRVLGSTHTSGKLSQEHTDRIVTERAATTCEVARGGALVMRPLLVHSSSASIVPRHRRVIHLDYAHTELDGGLQWLERRSSPSPNVKEVVQD